MKPWWTLFGLLFGLARALRENILLDALEEFNGQWDNLFEKHAHLDSIVKGVQTKIEGKLELRNLDFQNYVDETSKKFNKFFEKKIEAVKQVIETSEKTTTNVDFYQEWSADEVECYQYMERINKSDLYYMDLQDQKRVTGVHINVESFKCDLGVLRDFEWTGNQAIELVFQQNKKQDPSILRQYIGTYSGLSRVYPPFRWQAEPRQFTVDLFDPRLRPWFTVAETAPKDVMFLLDYSGSVKGQTLNLLKMMVMNILSTLTPNDYINAIWYNSKRELLLKGCVEKFIPATTQNKRLLQKMLDKVEEKDQAALPPAFEMSLDQFLSETYKKAQRRGQSSGGHKIIMLLTDGVEFWPIEEVNRFRENYPKEEIRVFGYSMGYGTGDIPALKWLSCEMDGVYSVIDNIPDLKRKSRVHLTKLVEPLAEELASISPSDRPVSISYPYMDTQGEGAVISLSSPVLNLMFNSTPNSFLGIAGLDISMENLRTLIESNEQFYGFIIDNNGMVYYHPKQKLPRREVYSVRRTACHRIKGGLHRTGTRIQYGPADERVNKMLGLVDSIFMLDILELETEFSEKFREFRDQMIKGDCQKPVDDGSKEYRCVRIENTPLVMGFVWNKEKSVLEIEKQEKEFVFEENDLIADWIRQPNLCSEFLSLYDPLDRYETLMDLAQKESECMHSRDQNLLAAFHRSIRDWRQKWPYLEENSTCELSLLPPSYSLHFKTAFVETLPGVVTMYPSCQHKIVEYFFEDQPQILQRTAEKPQGSKVRMDPFNNLITTYREVVDSDVERVVAIVGVIWDTNVFNELWGQVRENDDRWNECEDKSRKCLLVTNDLFVIGSNQDNYTYHLSTEEPELMHELVTRKLVQIKTNREHQAECGIINRSYDSVLNPTSFAMRPLTIFKWLWKLMIKWSIMLWTLPSTSAQPYFEADKCLFKSRETIEQCAVEENRFNLLLKQPTTTSFTKGGCNGSVTLLPSPQKKLHLVIVGGTCEEDERRAARYKKKYEHRQYRVPDCSLLQKSFRVRRPFIFQEHFKLPEAGTCSTAKSTTTSGSLLAMTLITSLVRNFYWV